MCVVRALHPWRRVGHIPILRQGRDQPVHADRDQFAMGTGPAVDEPKHTVAAA